MKMSPQEAALLHDQVAKLKESAEAARVSANRLESQAHILGVMLRANCPHDFHVLSGYEHEGKHCRICGLNSMHEDIMQVSYESKIAAFASCGDQANVCSSD